MKHLLASCLSLALAVGISLPASASIHIDWVTVGNPGNANDPATGNLYGAVAEEYRIMKFEFTNAQYAAFLNAIDPDGTNPNWVYNSMMNTIWVYGVTVDNPRGGIANTGTTHGSRYVVKPNMGDKPVNYMTWWNAARVCNWLHNGARTYAITDASATAPQNAGAYTLGTATSGTAPARNSVAQFYLPTENQWYKAAYYNPTLNGGAGGYHVYGNGYDTLPEIVSADAFGAGSAGDAGNFANYNEGAVWNGQTGNVTTVGTNGAPSHYGAFDMTGNVWEWNDLAGAADFFRGIRGGYWRQSADFLSSSSRYTPFFATDDDGNGFRLASPVPPTTPTISVSPSNLSGFSTVSGTPSAAQSIAVNGVLLEADITVTAPEDFEVSVDNLTFSQTLVLAPTDGNVTAATVYARVAATAPGGPVSGSLTFASTDATTRSVSLSGKVFSVSTSSSSLGNFATANGSASASQSFTVDASGLNEPLLVTAPPGFEVSTDNVSFSRSITISPSGGNVTSVIVYARIAPGTPVGSVSGNINLTSGSSYVTRTTTHGLGSNFVNGVFASGNAVYVATSPGVNGGLGVSTDGGTTFTNRNTDNSNLPNNYVNDVHGVGSTIFVATNGGLCISTDGGTSFTTRTTENGLGSNFVRGVFADGSSVYAATDGGLSISTDNGANFTNRNTTSGLSSTAVVDAFANGSTVYAAMSSFSPPGGVGISTNGGVNFTTRTTANGLGSPNVWDVFVADNTIYAGTGGGLSISTDGGVSFTNRTTADGLGHNNVNGVHVVGSTVYAATSGGLSISTDGGATFTNRTTADGLGGNGLRSVFVDENTVYACTTGSGLTMIVPGGPSGVTQTVAVSGQVQNIVALPGFNGNNTIATDYAMTDGYAIGLQLYADYLVVGGGGSGGTAGDTSGTGGGGGGGVLSGSDKAFPAGSYPVVVGSGGAAPGTSGSSSVQGVSGSNSTFVGVTALAGGGGGRFNTSGNSGSSGGGGGGRATTAGGAGTTGQGFRGGAARSGSTAGTAAGGGGGGGGAGAMGGNASNNNGGSGGAGIVSTITGNEITYGGGGGGGGLSAGGAGGLGGGGAGGTGSSGAGSGTAASGGGGGGAGSFVKGGDGGSGVVIVRYQGSQLATGGTIAEGSGSATGYTLHTFSTPGNATFGLTQENLQAMKAILTGDITGDGGLSFNGPGTLVLAGTNTYSGTTVISSGTVQLGNGGTTGSVPGPIVNHSVLAINRSDDFTLSNEISGAGSVVKLGSNTLTVASSVEGPISVDAGTLLVTGSTGAVAVNSGGMLAGTGSTGDVTLGSGTSLSPGNDGIGTLTTGNLTLAGGSVWNLQTNSATGTAGADSDLIESTGALTISATAESPVAFNVSALGDFSLTGVKQASWTVGRFPGGITGFSADAFAIDTTGLTIPTGGQFTLALGDDNTLVLLYQFPHLLTSVTALGDFNAVPGNASAAQSFTVNGTMLQGAVTLTAPSGFEISTDNATFSSSLEVNKPAGTIQSVYRGGFGDYTTASGKVWFAGSGTEIPNGSAFAALTSDGSVVTWGNATAGGNSTSVAGSLSSNVTALYSTKNAFAALKNDGSVVTWGDSALGGNSTSVAESLSSNVTAVFSTEKAFAALKSDGSVVTWGDAAQGGDSTSVAGDLSSNVTTVFSNQWAFAALKSDGSVVTWGRADTGGDSTSVAERLSSNVTAVFSTASSFAALKNDGSVVTWGNPSNGGNSSSVAGSLNSNVTTLFPSTFAFVALKTDGSVVTWGSVEYGGNSDSVAGSLSSNVKTVFSNTLAFAALKTDGSVVTWGGEFWGGNSSAVAGSLSSNVTAVYSTERAFAALKTDGSVVTWGDAGWGGDSSAVAGSLSSSVTAVYATEKAFAALKTDGSVVTWGDAGSGGNSSAVAGSLSSDVTAVYSTLTAFAALKSDGSVVTWGNPTRGGSGGPANIGAAGTLPATVYVRIAPMAPLGPVSGDLTLASSGVETETISLSGLVGEGQNHTHQELWRFANFGSYLSEASGADNADPDGDGISNLMEYALGLNPNTPGVIPAALVINGGLLEYTYTRDSEAREAGLIYQIEWSDTLELGSWSTENVTQQIESTAGALETVKASVPAGSGGRRFLRLRVGTVAN